MHRCARLARFNKNILIFYNESRVMITQLLAKIFGTKNSREVARLRRKVALINELEPKMMALSDSELTEVTATLKEKVSSGRTLEDILPEAFAAVREASRRSLNMRHYDVQLIGGMALHEGKIAEMKTGEGKTLVATLALYLNSLSGKGAHLVTINDYLVRRDAEWMKPIYDALGVSVGILQNNMSDEERQAAYAADITYGTNSECGFDYLRDNMKFDLSNYVQREHNFAIVDEVDSILIDEARTPLIISGPAEKSSLLYEQANKAVLNLKKDEDYELDEKSRSVHLSETGTDKVEQRLHVDNLFAPENTLVLHHVNQALRAHTLFAKDVDYVVREGEVLIVDEFTGRMLPGRRYSDGLHQALEAKEGVKIERENQTLASITLQNYFRLYKKLAGMTGTALTEAEEFHRIYKLDVVAIPTNKPLARVDEPDAIFLTQKDKFEAIIEDIIETHKKGMPILVGTVSVETSEYLGHLLSMRGIQHEILNAKHHAREADIVAGAGEYGKVTIATNMAGRGTDIKLGQGVKEIGGLRIIGTERHESRRIDNQLRGRAGRQGDPGSSKFYLSLEDNLIRIFAGDRLKNIMIRVGMVEGERIEHDMVSRSIEGAQEKVEKHHFESRKNLIEYDDVLNQQRKVVYDYRRQILEGGEHTAIIVEEIIHDLVESLAATHLPRSNSTLQERASFFDALATITGVSEAAIAGAFASPVRHVSATESLAEFLKSEYQKLRAHINPEVINEAEKWLLLELIDQYWKIHLQVLDSLKEGIGLRGYGQKNPLIEYKKEAFDTFVSMMNAVKTDVVTRIFHINANLFSSEQIDAIEKERLRELENAKESGPAETGEAVSMKVAPIKRELAKVGRNDVCTCGSGKKYKTCCGRR
ncbi:MAG: preprotein translocase subunit SecA [Candidatus Dependentiae bacterium]|nr:preprotein translocase subunit SecA [Candidatus Dependentiae bacterium]